MRTTEAYKERQARQTAAYYARIRKQREKSAEANRRGEYINLVRKLTKKTDLSQLPGIELRGKGYCLDHRVSCLAAYLAGWPPEQAAAIENLQVLPMEENRIKGAASWSSLDAKRLPMAA